MEGSLSSLLMLACKGNDYYARYLHPLGIKKKIEFERLNEVNSDSVRQMIP